MRLLALHTAALFAGSVATADDKNAPKDEEAIVGKWQAEMMDDGSGRKPPADLLERLWVRFEKGGKGVLPDPDGKEREFTFKLDSAAKPKTIDLDPDGRHPGLGLYSLDGDTLVLVMPQSQSETKTRPTETKAVSKATIAITYKRVKDGKKDKWAGRHHPD